MGLIGGMTCRNPGAANPDEHRSTPTDKRAISRGNDELSVFLMLGFWGLSQAMSPAKIQDTIVILLIDHCELARQAPHASHIQLSKPEAWVRLAVYVGHSSLVACRS